GPVLLLPEDLARIVEGRLDDADDVERVVPGSRSARGILGIQQVDRGERERGQGLIEREVRLELHDEPDLALAGDLNDAGLAQRAEDREGPPRERVPLGPGWWLS